MPKALELTQLPPKILIYGPPGSGKTALTYTLGEKLQVIEMDRGWGTALKLKDKFYDQRVAVDIVQCYPDRADLNNAVDKVKAHLRSVQAQLAKGDYPFKILALDSLTALGEAAFQYVVKNSNMQGKPVTQAMWGLAINEVEMILTFIRSLPIGFVMIGHDRRMEVDDRTELRVNVIGQKLPDNVPMYFDEIWYTRAKNEAGGALKYRIQTRQSTSILARSRANLPDNQDMDEGMPALLEKLDYKL